MTLNERVAWALNYIKDAQKFTWPDLADKFDTDKNTVAAYSKGGGLIKGVVIERIVTEFGFSSAWMLEGKGEPFPGALEKYPEVCGEVRKPDTSISRTEDREGLWGKTKREQVEGKEFTVTTYGGEGSNAEQVPEAQAAIIIPEPGPFDPAYFDFVPMAEAHLSGGGGAFVLSEKFKEYYAFRKDWIRRIATSPKSVVLMPIRGTSMQPSIQDGDVVMLDTGRIRVFDGQIYALGLNDTIMIKRLENIVGGKMRIISENRLEFPPYEVEARRVRIIGQVIWFARELVPRE